MLVASDVYRGDLIFVFARLVQVIVVFVAAGACIRHFGNQFGILGDQFAAVDVEVVEVGCDFWL